MNASNFLQIGIACRTFAGLGFACLLRLITPLKVEGATLIPWRQNSPVISGRNQRPGELPIGLLTVPNRQLRDTSLGDYPTILKRLASGKMTPYARSAAYIGDLDAHLAGTAFPCHGEFNVFSDASLLELAGQVWEPVHRLPVDGHDNVAKRPAGEVQAPQSGALGRCSRLSADDHNAFGAEACRDGLIGGNDADARRRDPPGADQLRYNAIHYVYRNGETDARTGPGRRNDRGVYADEP